MYKINEFLFGIIKTPNAIAYKYLFIKDGRIIGSDLDNGSCKSTNGCVDIISHIEEDYTLFKLNTSESIQELLELSPQHTVNYETEHILEELHNNHPEIFL